MQTVSKLHIRSFYLVFTYDSVCLSLANRLGFERAALVSKHFNKDTLFVFFREPIWRPLDTGGGNQSELTSQ